MSEEEKRLGQKESLGLGLLAGDLHYRAYVGPPEDYDLIAAMTFNLLTTIGARQHHAVLDVGCGSLRVGRLLIPYLNTNRYVGIEPNQWLVEEGIRREVGRSLVDIKEPSFIYSNVPEILAQSPFPFDFAVAQSIFSHCGPDLVSRWLSQISLSLLPSGALLATYIAAEKDSTSRGWSYPECVAYRPATLKSMAAKVDLGFETLDWKHPRQTWAVFAREDFDTSWFKTKPLVWNTMLENLL